MHLKMCLKQGSEIEFFELVHQMEQFATKYGIKKIKFKPNPLFVKKITETYLLRSI
jgi:hypothetical protein